jgi:murein DD-endopeptidase MepM/ murein hydrolase activator NlpD
MGSHRAASPTRATPPETTPSTPYVGRRVAAPVVGPAARTQAPGKRKAVKHAGARGPLFPGLPSAPVLLGVATLAVAVSGVVLSGTDTTRLAGAETAAASPAASSWRAASAVTGSSGVASVDSLRGRTLDRASSRDALEQSAGQELVEAAEAQVEVRNEALGQLQAAAEQQARELAENRWVQPLGSVALTARYGQYGLWATYHTGLDFNGNTGDPISAVAGGTVTFAGYDGPYGNKTVVTLTDGTEMWYAHQTSQYVSVGDTVASGDTIGTVGATGNVTGSHLHLEVRPGGGDPVDPYAAMVVNGVAF